MATKKVIYCEGCLGKINSEEVKTCGSQGYNCKQFVSDTVTKYNELVKERKAFDEVMNSIGKSEKKESQNKKDLMEMAARIRRLPNINCGESMAKELERIAEKV